MPTVLLFLIFLFILTNSVLAGTAIYLDDNPINTGNFTNLTETASSSCSIFLNHDTDSGLLNCVLNIPFTCSSANPKDSNTCWVQYSCQGYAAGNYTATLNSYTDGTFTTANPGCESSFNYTVRACAYNNTIYQCNDCPAGFAHTVDIYNWTDGSGICGLISGGCVIDANSISCQLPPDIGPFPSPTPSPSPSPIVTPFLDLPWKYEEKGLSFTEAALAINSYFDHEYPLLSSGLSEGGSSDSIINYLGPPRVDKPYSSHDGYDYGKSAGANIGDPVLAAADGCASYATSGAGGNIIKIDHGNGYQTRYLHMQADGLITTDSSTCIDVVKGQQIGKVGATGNVIPAGDKGAHIHFMIIQDKNGDGNFDDNIPDGLLDPFGWQSSEPDPWPNYTWQIGDQTFSGNTSNYLWTKAIANLSDQLTSNGGFFELERYSLDFPQGSTNQNLDIKMESGPIAKPSGFFESIGSTLTVLAKDVFGNPVTGFFEPFTLEVNYSTFDISKYKAETISIYSSEDGTNWTKEDTTVDPVAKTASAQLNHLTHFALMAERIDTIAPVTNALLEGDQGQDNWFHSNVQLALDAQDNDGGLGVDYTLFKLDEGDWQEYSSPIQLADEGQHQIDFYSVDNDENIEEIKTVEFDIDKTPPIASLVATPNILWPPNNKMVNVTISGSAQDNASNVIFKINDEYDQVEPPLLYLGQTIQLQASRREDDKDGRKYTVNALDFAGNSAENVALITVPHSLK